MTAWLILTGFGLDDWFYRQLVLQSLVITINLQPNHSFLIVEDSLHSCSLSFYDWLLIYEWTIYMVSRQNHRKHCFLYCYIYSLLHSNGSYPVVVCICIAVKMCLPSCFPVTGLHVTICLYDYKHSNITTMDLWNIISQI
jgi:hypothetical protein